TERGWVLVEFLRLEILGSFEPLLRSSRAKYQAVGLAFLAQLAMQSLVEDKDVMESTPTIALCSPKQDHMNTHFPTNTARARFPRRIVERLTIDLFSVGALIL